MYENIKKWMKVCHIMNINRDPSCAKVHNRVKTGVYIFLNVDKDIRGWTLMERVHQVSQL